MAIKAMFNRVWVKPQVVEQKTASGLFMPTEGTDKMSYGEVVSSSLDDVKGGSVIVYQKGRGLEAMYQGDQYIVLQREDILAIIE